MPTTGPIIIVEHDKDDQELIKGSLADLQIPNHIRLFDTALTALDYLMTTIEKPFLVIADINLPAMSGLELLKRIHESHLLKKKCTPFIFFSNVYNNTVVQQAFELSAHGFFVKPVFEKQLKETIASIFNYWKLSRAPLQH